MNPLLIAKGFYTMMDATDLSKKLTVLLNDVVQLEYDRSKVLPERQLEFIHKMYEQMSLGLILDNEYVDKPDDVHKAKFIAVNLVNAIKSGDEARAAATCSYLAVMLPELKQVVAHTAGDSISLDLIFDREYTPQVTVGFHNPPKKH